MPVAFRYGNISIYNENGNILSLNNFAFYNYIEILSSHISNNLKLIKLNFIHYFIPISKDIISNGLKKKKKETGNKYMISGEKNSFEWQINTPQLLS